ncbi:hypothetical protein TNCV_1928021 [Trichonephila clavipes]|nr:hypothetical protein TNCV_1928021 [Trichonephila clavipes]
MGWRLASRAICPEIAPKAPKTTDPFCFDAVRANAKLDNCSTCAECEDLCDALEDILDALHKPDNNTPERLRVINEVQWIALKCSRKSTKLQCQEFKDYIKEIERLNTVKVPTATAASKTAKRRKTSERLVLLPQAT